MLFRLNFFRTTKCWWINTIDQFQIYRGSMALCENSHVTASLNYLRAIEWFHRPLITCWIKTPTSLVDSNWYFVWKYQSFESTANEFVKCSQIVPSVFGKTSSLYQQSKCIDSRYFYVSIMKYLIEWQPTLTKAQRQKRYYILKYPWRRRIASDLECWYFQMKYQFNQQNCLAFSFFNHNEPV